MLPLEMNACLPGCVWNAKKKKKQKGTGGCDGCAKAQAKRSHPTSEVRGRSWEDPMPMGGGQEELPHVRGQGQRPRVPDCDGAGTAERSYPVSEVVGGVAQRRYPASEARGGDERSYPTSEVRGGNERSYPASEVRGGGREEIPHAPSPRPGAAAGTTNPMSKEPWLRGCRRA